MGNAISVQSGNFVGEVLEYPGVVLVDFWGPGCAPCRALAPILDKLAVEFDGRAKIVKCNIAEAADVATHYGVTTLPTLFVFKNAEIVEQFMGVQSRAKLQAVIEENL